MPNTIKAIDLSNTKDIKPDSAESILERKADRIVIIKESDIEPVQLQIRECSKYNEADWQTKCRCFQLTSQCRVFGLDLIDLAYVVGGLSQEEWFNSKCNSKEYEPLIVDFEVV